MDPKGSSKGGAKVETNPPFKGLHPLKVEPKYRQMK